MTEPGSSHTRLTRLRQPMPLGRLVGLGTGVVSGLGLLIFTWLAWLLSHQPAPCIQHDSCLAWWSHVDGAQLFDAARTTVTILAVIGIGDAALVTYTRQDTPEQAHQVAIATQQTAAEQLALDSKKYDLDRERHQLEVDRRNDDRERELRTRFASIAEQLGSKTYAVRHAGAYALAALADDWHQFGQDAERQVCVDLLCAQLRSPREDNADAYLSDLEVRQTMVSLFRSYRPLQGGAQSNWKSCPINLAGADLTRYELRETDLAAADLSSADLTIVNLTGADLSAAQMNMATIDGTNFSKADLTDARLLLAWRPEPVEREDSPSMGIKLLDFRHAKLCRAWLHNAKLFGADFKRADLTEALFYHVDARGVSFSEATAVGTNFDRADLRLANFSHANLSGADLSTADITAAHFENTRFDEDTKWPNDVVPHGAFMDKGGPSAAPEA